MQMILKIYKNNEQVNERDIKEPIIIYRNLAEIFYMQLIKQSNTTEIIRQNNEINIIQKFDNHKYGAPIPRNTVYTYKYKFVDVDL